MCQGMWRVAKRNDARAVVAFLNEQIARLQGLPDAEYNLMLVVVLIEFRDTVVIENDL